MLLSIVTVNYLANDFLELLRESIQIFTKNPYEFIVVDNSYDNIGHGQGLNQGIKQAKGEFVCFVDVDCHFLHYGWDDLCLQLTYNVIGGKGVPSKPIRPCFMFMKRDIALEYDWQADDGYKGQRITPDLYDVAIRSYYQMIEDKISIQLLESQPSRYATINGEEYLINNTPICYHHWSGTYLQHRQKDFPNNDLFLDKVNLFQQIPWRIL